MTTIKPIHDPASYQKALVRVEGLMGAELNSPEGDELEILSTLVHAYEETRFPIDIPDALTAILFVMEQRGYAQKDFAALIGKSRASEVLNKKRAISMKQARILYREWGVPAETLLLG